MILERLKSETRMAHQSLEKMLVPKIKNIVTALQYNSLLQMFYGFYYPLEQSINNYIDDSIIPDYNKRRKAGTILKDINSINAAAELPLCTDMPEVTNTSQALGALYVLEGSTLGGQVICQMLEKNLDLPDGKALTFFTGYGIETQTMWQSFVKEINHYMATVGNSDDMVASANDTFIKINNWAKEF